jgi:uroporphyrinogen decarboxylase
VTHRERVLRAFAHAQSDTVPIDFGGHRSSGIAAIAYAKLRDHIGLPNRPIRVYDVVQQLAVVDEDVLARFGADAVEMGRGFATEAADWRDWVLPDGTPCQIPTWTKVERAADMWVLRSPTGTAMGRMPDGALYFEQQHFPFAEADDLEALPSAFEECMRRSSLTAPPPGPLAAGAEGQRRLREGAVRFRAKTDRAVIGLFGGNLFEAGQFLYRNDNFFMLLASEPRRAEAFLDRMVELHLANLRSFLAAVGDSIDIIAFGDDLGMQSGPQISPEMYRRIFKPRHKLLWETAKSLAPVKVMLHCCGGVRELLPDLIDAGLDAINPVQITCRGMEPDGLKRDFGRDIVFWGGGCDTREILPRGSPQAVRDHVRRQVEIMSKAGGFVFQQVHNILANVPPENIVAMFDAVRA